MICQEFQNVNPTTKMNASCINELCTVARWEYNNEVALPKMMDVDHQATEAPCREVALIKGGIFKRFHSVSFFSSNLV